MASIVGVQVGVLLLDGPFDGTQLNGTNGLMKQKNDAKEKKRMRSREEKGLPLVSHPGSSTSFLGMFMRSNG